ncbi:hypothetical protein J2S52_003789 [Streptomyces sp. DSM 41037]|nr:hypothetical protein [Streptomyces sp. DSM 41037]
MTTTTVRGLAAATTRTRSSWRPGSVSEVIEALGLAGLGGGDDHHRRLRLPGGFGGLGDQLVRITLGQQVDEGDADALQGRVGQAGADVLQADVDGGAGGQLGGGAFGGGAEERLEGVAGLAEALRSGPEFAAADGQAEGAEAAGAEGVAAGLGRGVAAGDLDAVQGVVGDALGQVAADPLVGAPPGTGAVPRTVPWASRQTAVRAKPWVAGPISCCGSAPTRKVTACSPRAARRPSSGEVMCGGKTVAEPPPRARASRAAAPPLVAVWDRPQYPWLLVPEAVD